MDNLFDGMKTRNAVIVYMDDILIFAETEEELKRYTKEVLQILEENDLYLKPEKCEFNKTSIKYLGFVISPGRIEMDPTKLRGITEWPAPKTLRHLRSFLGFGNFYRRFIHHYSDLTKPLNELLQKKTKWNWSQRQEEAFETLKERFASEPVLMMPDQGKPFILECDASKYASGAILSQMDQNGDKRPVAFLSQSFNQAERNYEVYDRELLAVMRALEEWRHYLQGGPFPVTVYSDHRNLGYFRQPQKLNRRQARWVVELSEYDLNLIHLPGEKMAQADALSRRPDHDLGDDHDNENVTILPDSIFINFLDTELRQGLQHPTLSGPELFKEFQRKGIIQDPKDWRVDDTDGTTLLYQERQYVPDDIDLRRSIVQRYHDSPTAGHPGELGTFISVSLDYWWPGMRTFVRQYVAGCAPCQQFKINRRPTKPALVPIPSSSSRPFAQCSMDFITDLPERDGFNSILSVVDHGLTKGAIFIPCSKSIDSEQTAQLLVDRLFSRFGLSDSFISDRGPQFASRTSKEYLKLLGINSNLSTAFHPQSDGTTERYNQEIEAYLSIYCINNPTEWVKFLPILEFTHNNRRHSDRQQTPFELMYGYAPRNFPLTHEKTEFPHLDDRLLALE